MEKIFKVAQIRELLNQVYSDKITFSRFVEILNEKAESKKKFNIQPIDKDLHWAKWLEQSPNNGLQEHDLSQAVRELHKKVDELTEALNSI
jgi:hypothetical protein